MPEEIGSAAAGNPEGETAPEANKDTPAETNDAKAGSGFLSTVEDDDLRSWAESKGLSAPDQALSSYRNLEKVFGADKAGRTVVLLGDEPTPEEQSDFYTRLGRPKDPKGYEFTAPEGADPAFSEEAKVKFHELGLTAHQAEGLAEWYNGQVSTMTESAEAQYKEQIDIDTASLRKEWGAAYDKNVGAAKSATKEFGLDEAQVDGLEASLGFGGLMRFMHSLGSRLGEDTVDGSEDNVGSGLMTPESAKQAMLELNGSKEWFDAWMDKDHPGHAAAVAKKQRLSKMMIGEAP
jgi:hypothetical protein|tara:strand:- start:7241 stop:8116 length:876 start_codon:yes stop_codon:yes gene_type:complete